ncbi:MAG: aspartate aminotransferase family protein [Bacteroidia bacterium]
MSANLDALRQAYDTKSFVEVAQKLIVQLAESVQKSMLKQREEVIPFVEANDFWETGIQTDPDNPMSIFEAVEAQSIRLHHPRYLGHQIAPVVPMVSLAGFATMLLNNGMGTYEMGMAGTIMEREVLDIVSQAIGYEDDASGIMTSGGTLANLTALLAARQVQSDHDIWEDGYQDGERMAIMVSAEAHYSVQRAVKIMGWGEKGIIKIPVDDAFRLRPEKLSDALEQARKDGLKVIAVVGSACSTATGSFDPLDEIAAFCEAEKLWFHVDAAHGGPAVFSPTYCSLLKGIEKADSVLMDFHKMALCPALCTALIFKNGQNSYKTFAQKAAYLWEDPSEQEWHNLGRRTFECTKQMMSLAPFILFRQFGPELLGTYVETMFELGHAFGERIVEQADFELLIDPACNIVCFRYAPDICPDLNVLNRSIRVKLRDGKRFYIVQTDVAGQLYLRCALMNPFTEIDDLQALLDEIRTIGEGLFG